MFKDRFLTFLSQRRTGNMLALLVIAVFLVLTLIRLSPLDNRLQEILSQFGDDWQEYALYGVDIKHNGLLMPAMKGVFTRPAGFSYCYFLASIFVIFGENSVPVYIIQNIMLGLSVALIYWTFRDKMKAITGLLFLAALFLFALLDVYKYYSFRFLSENLALFLVSLFFFCFIKGFEKNKLGLQLISASLIGPLILTRPNTVLFGLVLILIVMPYYLKKGRPGIMQFLLFVSILALFSSFLGIRNYLLCRRWLFLPAQGASLLDFIKLFHPIPASVDLSKITANFLYAKLHISSDIIAYIEYMRQEPLLFFSHYLKKILFSFGFMPIIDYHYRFRPHWMLMWIGYFTYLFFRIRSREKLKMWETAVHLYIFCYYSTLIISAPIDNYGFRMLVPGTNFVLLFSFLLWDRLQQKGWSHSF